MKRLIIILFFFLFYLIPKAEAYKGTITFVHVLKPNHPVSNAFKKLYGEAFKRLGYQYRQIWHPIGRAYRDLSNQRYDGITVHVTEGFSNKEYKEFSAIKVRAKISSAFIRLYFLKSNFKVKTIKSLVKKAHKTGLIRYSRYGVLFLKKYKIKKFFYISTYDLAVKMLLANRIDLLLAPRGIYPIETKSKTIVSIPVMTLSVFPMMHKKHEELASKLALVLRQMQSDGTFRRIMEPLYKNLNETR